ncbi:MAG: class I SAM-dependent methyltransferase [Armatimonadota bacterium]
MSDPYASVADNYDIMIDWPARLARERPFFAALFAENAVKRVLDVGCGTGHHSRMFAELGAQVTGMDPSAPMLARAEALTTGNNPRFVPGGFAEIPQLDGRFDFIAVLGNTLAHVKDERRLAETLVNMRGVLTPGSLLCIQLINYDSLQAEESRWLPLINRRVDDREYIFLREHRALDGRAEFTIITLIRSGEEWIRQVERDQHLALTSGILGPALENAGFGQITLLGSYAGEPFESLTSPSMIVLAEG